MNYFPMLNQKSQGIYNMRIGLVLVFFWSIYNVGNGQSEASSTEKKYKHEIALNATNLLSNLFSLSNDNLSTPYTFVYRHKFTEKFGIHFGLGADLTREEDVLGGSNLVAKSVLYDARFGIDKIIPITKKLNFIFGLDAIAGNAKNSSSSTGFDLTTSSFKLGGGPAIRIQYHLNDRVVFMTEGLFYFIRTKGEREEVDPRTGIALYTNTTHRFTIAEPRALFIGFKF